MKNPKEIQEKLAGARKLLAFTLRTHRATRQIESLKEATLFTGAISALEWVLEHDREEVRK